jgi:hypothetical protein
MLARFLLPYGTPTVDQRERRRRGDAAAAFGSHSCLTPDLDVSGVGFSPGL